MGSLNLLEIDYSDEFAVEVRKTHYNLVTAIEKQVGKKLPLRVRRRILLGNNLAYMSFKGKAAGQELEFILWAHSAINCKSKLTEEFNELFSLYYCIPSDNPEIPSGSVNEKNNTLTYNEHINEDFEGNPIYNRNNDSESKLIETFLEKVGKTEVEGELFIYTTLGPCLSCERKIATLLSRYYIDEMENLNANVWYCTDYSNKNFI
ncbi:deaminase domain-containing protein [Sporosarcina sp. 179-K 8C2 HS]|uniref:deaminase domain-containing protein n=1 Tax=Sporosarcina sp. 179-K 8C2 HS TaxID=3142387 RepID=UPI00399F1955